MRITIISIYPFPYGMASSTRVASISRGLQELGHEVTVVVPEPPQPHDAKDDLPARGEWDGIQYVHLQGRKRNANSILRGLAYRLKTRFLIGVNKTRRWMANHRADLVFLYMDEPSYLEAYTNIGKGVGAKVVFNFDEFPVPIREKGESELPETRKLHYKSVLSNVDGYIAINKVLEDFYNEIVEKPTLEMSMVVDTNRFGGRELPRKEVLTYAGQILPDKDNIGNIIRAFKLIEKRYPNLEFNIYGRARKWVEDELKKIIEELNLQDKVHFKGFAPDSEVPNIMAESKVLVSSQPDNERVRGCLSTKLAEYVAMGTPTLMCNVGENKKYLSEKDCFFVEPDNPKKYAEALTSILDNYDEALKVAAHGRDTVRNKYSYISAAKSLVQFADTLR